MFDDLNVQDYSCGCCSAGQAGFWKGLTTLDHILILWCSAHAAARRACVPVDMQWGIYALYESVSGKVQSPNGLLEAVA